jgi:hypothetical protein
MSDETGTNPPAPSPPVPPAGGPAAAAKDQPRAAPAAEGQPAGVLARLDAVMAESAWYPRVIPFFAYLILLAVSSAVAERLPLAYPFVYLLQIGVVAWLLWRYRRLLPELTLSFHWLAVPTGVIVFVAWVWLGMVVDELPRVQEVGLGAFTNDLVAWSINPAPGDPAGFVDRDARSQSVFIQLGLEEGAALAWFAFTMRLIGMALVVPLFEELFIRSLLLRSFHSPRNSMLGVVQVAQDFPIIGERLMNTRIAQEADKLPPMFEAEFRRVPLGALSVFGVAASTLIFTLSHVPRDYAGCVFCGVAYCLCLYFTRHKGLGPVCWAHGITNALIWAYTLHTGDWRFL